MNELKANPEEEEIKLIYFDPQELRTREFNRFVDRMLSDGTADEEAFAQLTPVQMHVYSVLNRAIKRAMRLEYDNDIDS